jgi:hypothetical protein
VLGGLEAQVNRPTDRPTTELTGNLRTGKEGNDRKEGQLGNMVILPRNGKPAMRV